MLSVTFSQPIVIDPANLHSLLSLANAPALVEPYTVVDVVTAPRDVVTAPREVVTAPREGRKPRLTNGDPHAPAAEAPKADKADKPKRTRRTKAEMLAAKEQASPSDAPEAAATTEAEPVAETAPVADAPVKRTRKPKADAAPKSTDTGGAATADPAELLERFAKLIDADFGEARALLDEFGVNRFSDLEAGKHAAFAAKLTEFGV